MYATVKAGNHQEKIEVGDVILVNYLDAKKSDAVEFPVSLTVDGDKITLVAVDLVRVSVKAEAVGGGARGPKVSIQEYENKTGITRRKDHRQKPTVAETTAVA